MRYHGLARVSPRTPEAFAICDRCGALYNHVDLHWQYDWDGPRLQNQRILVCESCLDKPFEHNRTLILPPDPVAVANARPENYILTDNPISTIALQPLDAVNGSNLTIVSPLQTGNIGNMTGGAGVDAPYVGLPQRLSGFSAMLPRSQPGLNNWIGKFWSAVPGVPTMILPSFQTAGLNGLKFGIRSFQMNAPIDQSFLAGGSTLINFYGFDGTNWHLVWTGSSAGVPGEILSGTFTDQTPYYAHSVVLYGDGLTPAAIGYLQFNAGTHGIMSALVPDPPAPTTISNLVVMFPQPVLVGSPVLGVPVPTILSTAVNMFPVSFVDSSPTFGAPVLTTGATSVPIGVTAGAPSFGTPTLVPSVVPMTAVNMVSGLPIFGSPVLSVGGQPTSIAVGSPTLGTPTINQKIPMGAVSVVDAAPQISVPNLNLVVNFASMTASVSPIIGVPTENLLGVVNPIPPATALQTKAALTDNTPIFSIAVPGATSITTKAARTDNTPSFSHS